MGASGALEALVKLLPAQAHRLRADGSLEDVPVSALGPLHRAQEETYLDFGEGERR